MRNILAFLPRLWANWITLVGSMITTMAAFGLVIVSILELMASRNNSYRSGVLIVVLPLLFILGLCVIPVGFFIERRRARRREAQGVTVEASAITRAFSMAVSDPRSRGLILFVALFTIVNIVLAVVGGHSAVTFMDSPKFCGTSCHTAMEPEWTAYQRSMHNQVACVECHIGPGSGAVIKAKVNGVSQLIGVITGNHHRPVPAPVEHMRGSDVTCEGCHARARTHGDRVRMTPHYKPDKDNTPAFNVMLDHVGGPDKLTGKYKGIHAHLAPGKTIRFEYLDARRRKIGKITVEEDGKVTRTYQVPAGPKDAPAVVAVGERAMECVDCHNRPTHRFDGTARQAVEQALFEGRLDVKQPYIAKVATEVLDKAEVARDGAAAHFAKALADAYAPLDARPSPEAMSKLVQGTTELYLRNVFPDMKVRWNTYPDLSGHYTESDDELTGCLRCHDGKHETKLPDGKTLAMDNSCDLCHEALATEQPPAKFDAALKQILGLPN